MKVDGLDKEQLGRRLPPSSLTLAGLLKHLALVEDSWMHHRMLGEDQPEPWATAPFADNPDWELDSALDDDPAYLRSLYVDACDRSRAALGRFDSLDSESVGRDRRTGERFSLRWILVHLIEETARHNGHADLLRESIDGSTGE
jgi:uncharacterized damage-inducible protein DinB